MPGKAKLKGRVLTDSMKLLHEVTLILEQTEIPYILDGGTHLVRGNGNDRLSPC